MWVVFRKSDGQIVATSPAEGGEGRKQAALAEVVKGLVGSPPIADFEAIEVEKDPDAGRTLSQGIGRGKAAVRPGKEGKPEVVDEVSEVWSLRITTDAKDFHPVDKVPLIPGNGDSFLTITLQKVDAAGKPIERKTKNNDTFWLRTDHGTLRGENGAEIRSIQLAAGAASFKIQSEAAKRLASIQIFNENPDARYGLQVEFT